MSLRFRFTTPLIVAAASGLFAGAGEAASSSRFVVNGAIVTDTNTGLVWEGSPSTTLMSLSSAATYCVELVGSGFRLPTMKELQTIVDRSRYTPAVDTTYFTTVQPNAYWTSSTVAGQPATSWLVEFGTGISTYSSEGGMYYTWCVSAPAEL
jgi:hypothetical protein